jgi:hypothetical protein
MFKVLVLQTLYTLSDEQTEYQLKDRLSFMRFVGLARRLGLVARTIGMVRARVKIGLADLAYNLTRLAWLNGRTAPDGTARHDGLRPAKPLCCDADQPENWDHRATAQLRSSTTRPSIIP